MKSVLSQDFEKDAFEIIVVCNFVDEDLGQYLSSNGVKYLLVKADAVGKKIAEAVTISKGEILCFLEDDDLFTSQKLSTVSKIFKQHDVGFCLNSFTTIDIYGIKIKNDLEPHYKQNFIFHPDSYRNNPDILKQIGKSIRNSSITIRKKLVERLIKDLEEIKLSPDFFMFYSALYSQSSLYLYAGDLTVYRVHNSASNSIDSFESFISSKTYFLKQSLGDGLLIKHVMKGTIFEKYLDIHILEIKATLSLCSSEIYFSLVELAKSLLDGGRSLHNNRNRFALLLFTTISKIKRKPIMKLYYVFSMHKNKSSTKSPHT